MNSVTEIVFPCAIVAEKKTSNSQALLRRQQLQIALCEPDIASIEEGGYVLLDYGSELAGSVRILSVSGSTRVRLRLGESVSEACSDVGSSSATNDHAVRDGVYTLPTYGDQTFFNSGFRYLRIDCLEGKITLKAAVALYTHFAGEQLGFFECDNPVVNKIFDVSARTVMLNLQNDMIWDGIKRDRLVWIGDLYPEMMSATHLYGRLENIESALDFVREGTPLPAWMNTMPTYSMWWIVILHDYCVMTGADAFVKNSIEYVSELSKLINGHISDNGELDLAFFLDWPTHEKADEAPGVHALALIAMRDAIELCERFGSPNPYAAEAAEKLSKYAVVAKSAKQAIAMQHFAGIGVDHKPLTDGGCAGMSTFMSYFILSAVHETAGPKQAISMLEDYYGGMLKLGATSFWEDFDIEWLKNAAPITRLPLKGEVDVHASYGDYCYKGYRHSLCHGWASGPVPYLFRYVLGFMPLEIGCRKVRIKPDLGPLKYINACIPVPGGVIHVSVENGKKPIVKAPNGVEVTTE